MKRFTRRDFVRTMGLSAGTVILDRLLVACNLKKPNGSPADELTPGAPGVLPSGKADIIYNHGVILTMDKTSPTAEAIAIQGDKILAVGTSGEVLNERGANTQVIDLDGHTLLPGFIDCHSHIINSSPTKEDFLQVQNAVLSGGITTTTEVSVTPELLDRLQAYEYRGYVRVRYNTYLLYNTNCGDAFDPIWYKSHAPRQDISSHVRNLGVKIFSDGGSCHVPAVTFEYPGGYGHGDLFMTQDQMNGVVAEAQAGGYQVAIHALGDRAIEQVMNAIELALAGQPNTLRHRIDHNAVVREDMAPRYGQIGIVPVMFGGYPTCVRDDPNSKFKYVVPADKGTEEWAYRSILDANPGLHAAWHADYPVFKHVDPISNLYGFVTRNEVAEDGSVCPAPDFLLRGAITADEALHIMTMGSAYALFRENELGSLEPGKLADMVILSDNPLQVQPESIKDLKVLTTMIGGHVEFCADGSQALCPA